MHWLENLKARYLADEASVFVLHGQLAGTTEALVEMLSTSKDIVGVLRPGADVAFPLLEDMGRFNRLVSSEEVLTGRPREAIAHRTLPWNLGRIWLALGALGTSQAYIVEDLHLVVPHDKRFPAALGGGAPALAEWCGNRRIRNANHVLILLAPELDRVRRDVLEAASLIEVGAQRGVERAVAPASEALAKAAVVDAQVEAAVDDISEGLPASSPAPGVFDAEGLASLLEPQLVQTLLSHPPEHHASRLPVLEAVGTVLHQLAPERFGALTWSVDEDGKAVVSGGGGDELVALWRSDIALDASAGMLLKEAPKVSEVGLRALSRRLAKRL